MKEGKRKRSVFCYDSPLIKELNGGRRSFYWLLGVYFGADST